MVTSCKDCEKCNTSESPYAIWYAHFLTSAIYCIVRLSKHYREYPNSGKLRNCGKLLFCMYLLYFKPGTYLKEDLTKSSNLPELTAALGCDIKLAFANSQVIKTSMNNLRIWNIIWVYPWNGGVLHTFRERRVQCKIEILWGHLKNEWPLRMPVYTTEAVVVFKVPTGERIRSQNKRIYSVMIYR